MSVKRDPSQINTYSNSADGSLFNHIIRSVTPERGGATDALLQDAVGTGLRTFQDALDLGDSVAAGAKSAAQGSISRDLPAAMTAAGRAFVPNGLAARFNSLTSGQSYDDALADQEASDTDAEYASPNAYKAASAVARTLPALAVSKVPWGQLAQRMRGGTPAVPRVPTPQIAMGKTPVVQQPVATPRVPTPQIAMGKTPVVQQPVATPRVPTPQIAMGKTPVVQQPVATPRVPTPQIAMGKTPVVQQPEPIPLKTMPARPAPANNATPVARGKGRVREPKGDTNNYNTDTHEGTVNTVTRDFSKAKEFWKANPGAELPEELAGIRKAFEKNNARINAREADPVAAELQTRALEAGRSIYDRNKVMLPEEVQKWQLLGRLRRIDGPLTPEAIQEAKDSMQQAWLKDAKGGHL